MRKTRFHAVAAVMLCASLMWGVAAMAQSADDLQIWRGRYAHELARPDGWLALVALEWLKPGETTVGSAPDNKLVLKHTAAYAAVFSQDAGVVRLHAVKGSGLLVDGVPANHNVLAADDAARSSVATSGGVQITVIHRGDRFYLRVKDAEAPALLAFRGLHWYPEDDRYRVTAKWVPNPTPKVLHIVNVLGQTTDEPSPGYAEFLVAGQAVRLEPTGNDSGLFFVFRDATAKSTTYGAGRFLSTGPPSHGLHQPGTVVLDFNRAHNPPCGYTPYATCPLPTPENRLSVPIPAGEKRYAE